MFAPLISMSIEDKYQEGECAMDFPSGNPERLPNENGESRKFALTAKILFFFEISCFYTRLSTVCCDLLIFVGEYDWDSEKRQVEDGQGDGELCDVKGGRESGVL